MSEDKDNKTEEPTQRKLDQAHEKGQTASSKEISHWLALASGALAVSAVFPAMAQELLVSLRPFLENPEDIPIGTGEIRAVFIALMLLTAKAMACSPSASSWWGWPGSIFRTATCSLWNPCCPSGKKSRP